MFERKFKTSYMEFHHYGILFQTFWKMNRDRNAVDHNIGHITLRGPSCDDGAH